jgi:tetratricopeptide (TPR) repeat protein
MARLMKRILILIAFLVLIGTSRLAIAAQSDSSGPRLRIENSFQDFQNLKEKLKESLKINPNSWKLYWQLARAQFYMGNRAKTKKEQRGFYSLCKQNAERSLEFNPESAGGSYFKAICIGKIGALGGIWSSLSMISGFREEMERVVQLEPGLEFGGPHRALGKLFHDLPFFLGGDLKRSIEHLKLAVQLGPDYSDNYFYLSESLFEAEQYESAKSALLAYLEKSQNEKDASEKRKRAEDFFRQIDSILH